MCDIQDGNAVDVVFAPPEYRLFTGAIFVKMAVPEKLFRLIWIESDSSKMIFPPPPPSKRKETLPSLKKVESNDIQEYNEN